MSLFDDDAITPEQADAMGSGLTFTPFTREWDCPVHGVVDATIWFHYMDEEPRNYCTRCWEKHLQAHGMMPLKPSTAEVTG